MQGHLERRANELNGKEWLKYSISIWRDIVKTAEEKVYKHPASFPEALVERLLKIFLKGTGKLVLDPFAGIGTTLVAAGKLNHRGIGFEIYDEFIKKAAVRLAPYGNLCKIIHDSAFNLGRYLQPDSVDIVITSPPYWSILNRRRSVDRKKSRPYGSHPDDLGNISSYEDFLSALVEIMGKIYQVLKPDSYCIVNVMDIRVKDKFYPLHSDLSHKLTQASGFKLDDIIIWDRSHEYNNLRPLGYPFKFRINRVHEYLLIFQK